MIRITFDHYPDETELLLAFGKHLDGTPAPKDLLIFANAAKQYVELKRNVISPRTVKEYLGTPKRLSDRFNSLNIYNITENDIQAEINQLAKTKSPKTRSPKTVFNYYTFIKSVLNTFRPDFTWKVTLPEIQIVEPYIPTDEEVKRFLAYIKENRPKYYALVILAAYGMRRSEIMAITADDLDGTTLHITKAKVLDENNNWIIKPPKRAKSRRDIEIPADVADLIREQGFAFNYHPGDISKVINTACKKLGINRFTLHKLRHYFATKLLSENVDVMTIASLGGWASPDMIYKRYGHAVDEKKKSALKLIDEIIE
jgi:integrase